MGSPERRPLAIIAAVFPKVAILCGGRERGCQEHSRSIPKPLIEIGGKPILWHVIQIYLAQGFRRFVLLTGYQAELIERIRGGESSGRPDAAIECVDDWARDSDRRAAARCGTGARPASASASPTPTASPTSICTRCSPTMRGIGPSDDDRRAARAPVRRRRAERRRPRTRIRREASQRALDQRRLLLLRALRARAARPRLDVLEREPLERLAAGGELRAYRHEGFWDCMDTYKDASCSTTCGRGRRAVEVCGLSGRSVLVTGAYGLLGGWLVKALLEARCAGDPSCAATSRRARRCSAMGLEARSQTSSTATSAPTAGRAGAGRVRGRQRLPPRCADVVGDRQPVADVDVRDEHPRHVAAARGVPAPRRRAGDRGLLRQGLRRHAELPYREDHRAAAPLSLRRLEGRDGPARPLLLAHVAAAGRGHAVREPVRRRRHQRLAADARGRSRRARRAGAGGPLRRLARARLPVRRGRRRRPTWRSGPRLGRRRRAGGEAFNAGGGEPAPGARRGRADLPAGRHGRASRTSAAAARRAARSTASGSISPSSAADRLGADTSHSRTVSGGRSPGSGRMGPSPHF